MQYNKDNPLRVITLCSGYDTQCLALERLKQDFPEFDYELVAWSEIDENAIRAHNVLFPQWADRNLGDMTQIDWEKAPQCDIIIYSTPCQSISQAGLQHGFTEGSGTRSSIIWYTRDALKVLKPKFALLENVAAMVSDKFLPMYNLWANEVQRLGYVNFAKLLNSKNYGVPQNRERIFLLSIRDDGDMPNYNWPEPMELTRKLNDMLDNNVDTRFYLNPKRVSDFVKENIVQIEKYTRQDDGEIEQLPDYLKEWLDNFESSKDDEKEESGEPSAECPYKEQEIGFDIS